VTVPERGVPFGFAAILNEADPLPLPVAPPVNVIHPALLVDDHAHPVGAVTAAEPVVAVAATDCVDGEIAYVQGTAACVTVKVCPAIVSVPMRCDAFGFGATLKDARPPPLPLVAPSSVIHAALLAAVHAHPAGAVTVDDPVAAPAPTDCADGEIAYVHGTAACVTV
jgi:hypothetical protein